MNMEKLVKLTRTGAIALSTIAVSFLCLQAAAQVTASSQTKITSALSNATGLAVDPIGNLYAADGSSNLLVELQGSNAVPTTVLSGLNAPQQVAVDALRNVYIANGASDKVTEIPYQSGSLNVNSTIQLGTGLGTVTGVAVDLSGNLYIVDSTNKQVVKLVGTVQTVLYSGLKAPKQIAVDRLGNVYIADSGANAIVLLPTGGGAATTVGTGLNAPTGVATDASNDLYIADTGNGRVLEIPYVTSGLVGTSQAVLTSTIASPASLALDSRGSVYVSSQGSIYRYTFGQAIYFGLLPVGTTSQTFPVTVTFGASAAPAAIKTLTTGITGLDFKDAGSDTCTVGTTYAAGNTCVMNVTFTPAAVGPRYGAIAMYDLNNKVIARIFLGGGGLGALLTVDPGTLTTVTPTGAPAPYTSITTPRGITTDAAGNIFLAENGYTSGSTITGPARITELPVGSTTPVVIATTGTNGVAINGAGDLIVASGGATVTEIPYENGTWNFADVFTLGSGYSRARVAKVDVAGNVFWCDANLNKVYEEAPGGTPVALGMTAYSTSCVGIAVDLYGNIVTADGSTGKILYTPATGVTPYETGSGFTSAWGVTFDPGGSVWISASGASVLGRIPNENGILVGSDQTLSTVGNTKDFDIWMDSNGTLWTTQDTGNVVTSFTYVNRSTSALTFATATPIGSTNATALTAIVSNSGNLPPIYSNGGEISLYDVDDFPAKTATNPCSFAISLTPGFTCNLAFGFGPLSSGTRAATVELSSNAVSNGVINLTGTASGAVTGTVTLSLALSSPATGSPAPGQSLTITGTAKPSASTTPTGALTFYIDGKPSSAVELANGAATFTIPAGLAAGTHTIGATYAGDRNYAPINTAVTTSITVVLATSTTNLSASGSQIGISQPVTFTATIPTLTGLAIPTGTVIFTDTTNNSTVGTGTLNGSGVASTTTTTLALGNHTVVASYSGDGVYAASKSSSVTVTVGNYAASTIALSVTPSSPTDVYGTSITASAIVAAQSGSVVPTGSVSFVLDGTPQAATITAGKASYTFTNIPAGAHTIIAYYSGDTTFASSTSTTFSFTITKATTSTTLGVSATAAFASLPITLTANVSSTTSTPTGTVIFYNGLAAVGSATVTNGVATLTTTQLPAGTDSITAAYQGDNNDSTSTSSAMVVTITLVPSTLTISALPSVILSGQTTTLTATLTGTLAANFSGSVTFYSGTTVVGSGTVSSSGSASVVTAALTASINSFTAVYSGSAVFTTSTSAAPAIVYVTDANGAGVIATTSLGTGLSSAAGVAIDISGNLYIADSSKNLVSLVAGGGGAQTTAASSLTAPTALAVDGAGDLFIANGTANHVTEILSQSGALVTSTAKQLGTGLGIISGVAVDGSGNVYIADATNKQLVKISGTTQTVLNSTLINPAQVAVDYLGDVYVADGTGNRVLLITPAGASSSVGTGLSDPTGVAVDPFGNVYISDTGNNRVVRLPFVSGAASTAGQTTLIASITAPGQLAADRHMALFITQASRIYKWQATAAFLGVIAPGVTTPTYTLTVTFPSALTPAAINVLSFGQTGGDFIDAGGDTCTAGTAYTAGQTCTVNVKFSPLGAGIRSGAVTFTSPTGQPLLTAYLGGVGYAPTLTFDTGTETTISPGTIAGVATGNELRGFAVDPVGNIYACDTVNGRIIKTTATAANGTLVYNGVSCASIALDGAGNLLVDDMGNSRVILMPNENGTVVGNDYYVVATGFSAPRGMGFDGFNTVYVADSTNIRVVAAPIGAGTASNAVIPFPTLKAAYDAAVDWQGNVAVADSSAGVVEYLPANGSGEVQVGPNVCAPYALAMDGAGAIYVTEISAQSACTGTSTPGDDVVRVVPGSTSYSEPDGHSTAAEGIYIDPTGNIYTAYGSGIYFVQRTVSTPFKFASTAVGSTSAAITTTLANAGPAPAVFANPSAALFPDSGDFGVLASSTTCNFTTPFAPTASCTLALDFQPVQSGVRTATYEPLVNATSEPIIALSGTATGTAATAAATLTLAVAPAKPAPNQSITITATLSGTGGTPTGTVTLLIDGVLIGSKPAAATINFTVSVGLSGGFHTATAYYSGDTTFASTTATLLFSAAGTTVTATALTASASIVAQAQQTTTNALSPAVVLTATVTTTGGTPSGVVIFYDGTTVLGTSTLSAAGVATYTISTLALGTHSLTAAYGGSAVYATSVSGAAALSVVYPGDYTLSSSANTITLAIGSTSSVNITATPVAGALGGFYYGNIGISCAGLPQYSTCAIQPATLALDGTGTPATAVLTIVTQAGFAQNSSPASRIQLCLLPAGALMLLFGITGLRSKRKLMHSSRTLSVFILLALGVLLTGATACGSHLPLATPTGNFQVTINAAGQGSNINHSITLQVNVTH
jgi:sugar lactone lactonase YvrE